MDELVREGTKHLNSKQQAARRGPGSGSESGSEKKAGRAQQSHAGAVNEIQVWCMRVKRTSQVKNVPTVAEQHSRTRAQCN